MVIQRRMIWITVIILGISIAQLVLAFFQFYASAPIQQGMEKAQSPLIEEVAKEIAVSNKQEQPNELSLPVTLQKQ